jgi:hypothetical protein
MNFPPMFTMWGTSNVDQNLFIVVNAIICGVLFVSSVCRARLLSTSKSRGGVIFYYVAASMVSVVSGGSYWLWSEVPGPGQISCGALILIYIIVSEKQWRKGPPKSTMKDQKWN